jgi:FG-GAP-like repeat
VWVFTRSNGAWTQQGDKLVGTGAVGLDVDQGDSVALSADGNTAVSGGPGDNGAVGAMWVFTRSNGVWTQQGDKLVGSGAVGQATQGYAVALSADGNAAIVGGNNDDGGVGAAWVFTRSNGVWTQQGDKLVGAGGVEPALQGRSVALSADGNTAMVGAPGDHGGIGAAWVFIQTRTATHDFNGDGMSDIAWRDGGGDLAFWLMSGATVLSSGVVGGVPSTWSIVGQRDFDGDGKADLLWRDTSGDTAIWFMNGTAVASSTSVGDISTNWTVVGVADFNGDGLGDLLWRDGSGDVAVWLMSGATVMSSAGLGNVPTTWTVVGTGDFNGDGMADILWRDNLGNTAMWFMNGAQVMSPGSVGDILPPWTVVGTGDFNGDGMADIVWSDTSGDTAIWLMSGTSVMSTAGFVMPIAGSVVQTGDYNGDGMSDLLWQDNLGNTSIWFMNGTAIASTGALGNIPTNWTVQSTNAD